MLCTYRWFTLSGPGCSPTGGRPFFINLTAVYPIPFAWRAMVLLSLAQSSKASSGTKFRKNKLPRARQTMGMYNLTVSENILRVVLGLGVLQGILLAALIYYHPKGDRSVNKWLAGFILGISGVMALPMIVHFAGWQNSFFVQFLPLIPGPFLYLYIRSFKEKITWRKTWPHFIVPFLWVIPTYFNILKFAKLYPDAEVIPIQVLGSPTTVLLVMGRPILQVVYYFLSRRELIAYQRSIRHLFSETSRIDLNWARFLVNGFLVLVGVFFISFPLMFAFPDKISLILLINMSVGAPYIYMATWLGIKQYTIWQA